MPVSLTPKFVETSSTSKRTDSLSHTVADFMTRNVVTFQATQNIFEAIDILLKKKISGAPVVDQTGKVLGMLSERDCLKLLFKRSYHNEQGGNVKEYMSTTIKSVSPDMTIVEIGEIFTTTSYRRLPVIDQGRLIGQISRYDVLLAVQQNHKTEGA